MTSFRHSVVDIGTPATNFRTWEWEVTRVHVHGFQTLPTSRTDKVCTEAFKSLGHLWYVEIHPGGDRTANDGWCSIYLRHMSNKSIKLDFQFCVKDSCLDDSVVTSSKHSAQFFGGAGRGKDAWGRQNFVKRADLLGALVEGTLVLDVRMRKTGQSPSSPPFTAENPFCKMMTKSFMDEKSADVMFQVEAKNHGQGNEKKKAKTSTDFYAHRLILQNCAPQLAELFISGSDDSTLTSVTIPDVKPEVFHHLLHYVYGGKVLEDDLKSYTKEIIEAADKYGVTGLKLEAEACYVKSTRIDVTNMMEHLLYADAKNCALLKETVMDFIVENGSEVLEKVSLRDAPGGLLADLLTSVVRGKKEGSNEGSCRLSTMRVSDLRREVHEKGLDIDGSRETLIATLKENSD